MLEALCVAGAPASWKIPAAPVKKMCAAGGPATGKMQVNPARRIVAARMAIFYDDDPRLRSEDTRAANLRAVRQA